MPGGTLTIVGLGPGHSGWVTLEAADLLRAAAANPRARAYGFPPVRVVATEVAPGLDVRDPVVFWTGDPTAELRVNYDDIVQGLLREAFVEGLDVLYLVSGNALVLNDLVLILRRTCARYRKPVRLVAGLSFVDAVVERIFWNASDGLQLQSAWAVASGRRVVYPQCPALLFELGEQVQPDGLADGETGAMLVALQEKLRADFPPDHPLLLLYSTGAPDHANRSRALSLEELAALSVPPLSNLWIPSLSKTRSEREEAP